MRKIYCLLSLCLLGLISVGCNDWLDVTPRSQIKSPVLYDTEGGYKLALNGVYIKMANSSLYGKNTTMYFSDALARMWTAPDTQTSALYGALNHNYTMTSVEQQINTIFSDYYNAIAQLNDLLDNLEKSKISFEYKNDKFLKGEALGLRAFLHLDILRYFGPVPSEAKASDIAIPYVKELTANVNELVSKSWQEVVADIEQDLNDAEAILYQCEPLLYNSADSLNRIDNEGKPNMPVDTWQFYRQGRFNYYAVLGTKARFYHWIGDKQQAVKYAEKVVASDKFKLCDSPYFAGSEPHLSMYREHLFGLHNPDLQNTVRPLFAIEKAELTQKVANVDIAYEKNLHGDDIRYVNNRYWQEKTYKNSVKVNHFYKYTGNEIISNDDRIPLLRCVEMYFILIEDLPLEQAKKYFVTYRQSRVLSSSIDDSSVSDENSVLLRMEKEYRKEFYGEGQLFFFYKKHGYKQITWPDVYIMPANAYVIPKPKGMINFE